MSAVERAFDRLVEQIVEPRKAKFCQSQRHHLCRGTGWSMERMAILQCECECHAPAELESVREAA